METWRFHGKYILKSKKIQGQTWESDINYLKRDKENNILRNRF